MEYTDGNCKYKVKKIGTDSGVLHGTILAFSGNFSDGYPIDKATGNADTTWHLCDGTNGTPDLRGRFILGASDAHAVGTTGGEEATCLEIKHLPPHSFSGTTSTDGNHSHTMSGASSGTSTNNIGRGAGTVYAHPETSTNGAHRHTFTTNTLGSGVAHNNMPPYYTLSYIMKL